MRECWVAYNPTTESKRKLPNKTVLVQGKKSVTLHEYIDYGLPQTAFVTGPAVASLLN